MTRRDAADALRHLHPHSQSVVRALLLASRDSDAGVQMTVLAALDSASGQAVPALVDALRDDHALVRAQAAIILGGLRGDDLKAHPAVVPALVVSLDDPVSFVASQSARALTRLGPAARGVALDVTVHLTRLARRPEVDARLAAIEALATVAPTDEALPVLQLALRDRVDDVRAAAAYAISRLGVRADGAASDLMRALADTEAQVRQAAAVALGAVARRSAPVLAALTRASGDSDEDVRRAATASLTMITAPASRDTTTGLPEPTLTEGCGTLWSRLTSRC